MLLISNNIFPYSSDEIEEELYYLEVYEAGHYRRIPALE